MASFDERAKDWDTPEHIERSIAVAEAVRAVVPIRAGGRAIELGAGTGLLGLLFAGDVAELVLTDPSAGMLDVADEKIQRAGFANVSTRRYALLADPLPGGGFDLVLSQLALHHVSDTAAALRTMFELLAPEGRLALADLDAEDGTFHDPEAEGIHHLGFARDDVARLAADAGFVDVAFSTATAIERDGRTYPLFLLVARRPGAADTADAAAAE
jgi:ubiquinone/menaquinone biosynthesis C-methylase UbiE